MDPAHPLLPRTDGSAKAGTEHRQHLAQCTTTGGNHDADPHGHQAGAGWNRCCRGFPAFTQRGQEIGTGGTGLLETGLATGAVKPDGGGIHQHLRWRLQIRHRLHQQARGLKATVLENLQVGRGPALLGDRLTGKVHHTIRLTEGALKGTVLPAGGLCRVKLQPGQATIAPFSVVPPGQATADQGELMVGLDQLGNQLLADKSSASQQQQSHGSLKSASGRLRRNSSY